MANDGLAGSEPQPDDDLRSTLSAAWDAAEKTPGPEAPEAPVVTKPEGETVAEKTERQRDEQGRFAKSQQEISQAADKAAQNAAATVADPLKPEQATGSTIGPPPGWSVAAKAAFEKADPAIRDAVLKREEEINNGFAKLQEYRGLDPYLETARAAGTTLNEALDRYIAAENLLSSDFLGGVRSLCQMYQIHPAQLAQALGGQSQQGNQNTPQPHDPFMPVMQKLSALEQRLASYDQQNEASEIQAINGQLAAFAKDPKNKFYENVRQTMGQLIGQDETLTLEAAYDKACWLNDEIRALRIKEATDAQLVETRRVADQNRRASGSLPTGAPTGKPNGLSQTSSLRASLESAWDSSTI